jgi:casein kinase 1
VALKLQDVNNPCPTNRYERGFYPSLQGGEGMPTLYAAGVEGKWDYLVIDLLGASLDSLFRKSGKDRMDLRSVCCIAMQVVRHSQGRSLFISKNLRVADIPFGDDAQPRYPSS